MSNFFNQFTSLFSSKAADESTNLPVQSVSAEVTSKEADTEGMVNVTVRYKLQSESFLVKAGSTMNSIFELVAQKFSIGNLNTVSILDEQTNAVSSLSAIGETVVTKDTDLAVEDTSGTAG